MSDNAKVSVKLANPTPLGLLGFGMTTILLNLHNTGILELSVMIVSMGLTLGGLAQIIAGIFEMKQGNTFGGTVFVAYGLFWWSLVFIWVNPTGSIPNADSQSVAFYLLLWGIFTLCMFIGTLKHNRATQVIFLTLAALFIALALADFSGDPTVLTVAGWIGLFCGASAVYTAVAVILNGEYGKTILPVG